MICTEHQCIFVHIPRTGGTSIEQKLGLFETPFHTAQDHRPIYVIHNEVDKKEFDRYFKFTIVRNPWSRLFSWYKCVLNDVEYKQSLGVPDSCSFHDFITTHSDQWVLKPQLYWLKDTSDMVHMDFIGRFNRLEHDFAKVGKLLGLKDTSLPRLLPAPELKTSGEQSYHHHYDPELKKIVADRYAEEIELFGFSFDDEAQALSA